MRGQNLNPINSEHKPCSAGDTPMNPHNRLIASCLAMSCTLLGACASHPGSKTAPGPVTQLSFSTPEDAVAALTYAVSTGDRDYARSLFGPEVQELSSGDPDVDAYERQQFSEAIRHRHELSRNPDGSYDILIGERSSPFPVPIVNVSDRWIFDTLAGVDRLTDVRIGYHELKTIEALRAVAGAQAEYQAADRNGDGVLEYASRFRSTAGTQDGLYWDTAPSEPNSPLGVSYTEGEVPLSATLGYNGYFYKILTRQGAGASGGARSYLDQAGRLTGGYAVLAYPAVYGETAIMTFQMGADGVIHQKDLGPQATPSAGRTISAFDPSDGWIVTNE
jgi:hypothetical protein